MESGRVTQNPLVLEEVSPAAEKLGISPPPSSAAANDSYEQSIYRIFNKQKDQGKKPLQQQQRQAIIHISQPTLATPTLIHQILDGKGPLIELAAAQDQHKLSHKHGVKFVKNPELRQTTGFSAAAVEAETTANYPATTSDSASLLTVSPRLGYSAQTPQTSMKSVSKSSSNSSLLKPSFESVSNTTLSSNPHHYHPRLRHRASLPAFSHHTANLQHPTRSSSLLSSSNTVAAGSSAGPLKKSNAFGFKNMHKMLDVEIHTVGMPLITNERVILREDIIKSAVHSSEKELRKLMLFNDMIIIGGVLLKNPRSVPAGQSRIGGKANVDLASSTASSCLTSETCTVFPFESFQVLANSETPKKVRIVKTAESSGSCTTTSSTAGAPDITTITSATISSTVLLDCISSNDVSSTARLETVVEAAVSSLTPCTDASVSTSSSPETSSNSKPNVEEPSVLLKELSSSSSLPSSITPSSFSSPTTINTFDIYFSSRRQRESWLVTTAKAISAYKAKKNALFNRLKRAVSKDSFSSVNSTSVVGGGIFYSQSSSSSSLSKAAAGTLSFLTAAGSSTGSIGFEMGNSIWKSISSTTSSIMTGGGGVGGSYITDTKGELQKDFTDENAKDTSTGSIGRSRGHEIAGFAENWIPDQEATLCMICKSTRFSLFNRKHHCRKCGRIICHKCSDFRSPSEFIMDFEEDEENGENIRKMASYNRGEAIEEGVVEVRQPALPGDSPPDPQTSALPSSSLSSLQHDRHQSDAFSIASLNSVTSTQDLEKIRVCKECSDEITNTLFDQEALHHFGLL